MSRSRSKKSKATQTPLFIQKLIDMLQDSSINHIISWTTSNDSFHIKSISQFTQTILPRFFKHNNFSSFIRQLNMYGFRKIRHQDGQNVYENEHFKRGNRTILKNIKRKVNLQRQDRIALYAQQGHSNNTLSRQINEMKTKQKDLQQICRHLLLQNHKLIEENNNLMKKMKDQERKKQRKIEQLLIAMIASSQHKQPAITSSQGPMMIQDNGNLDNVLSLMTGDNDTDLNVLNQKNQDSPLQVLTNALSRNKSMKQFKQMLQNYYNTEQQNRNENNLHHNLGDMRMTRKRASNGIMPNNINNGLNNITNIKYNSISPDKLIDQSLIHDDESVFLGHDVSEISQQHPFYNQQSNEADFMKPIHQDQQGFISINDFMNLDEQKPILQDGDNINLQQSN